MARQPRRVEATRRLYPDHLQEECRIQQESKEARHAAVKWMETSTGSARNKHTSTQKDERNQNKRSAKHNHVHYIPNTSCFHTELHRARAHAVSNLSMALGARYRWRTVTHGSRASPGLPHKTIIARSAEDESNVRAVWYLMYMASQPGTHKDMRSNRRTKQSTSQYYSPEIYRTDNHAIPGKPCGNA